MDTVSRFDLASFVAVMNMLKYNSMDKPELYRTLLAVLCDYDSDDEQSKERTHRYIQLLVTDTVLAEFLICYLPNNEDPLFLGKPRLPPKSHSKKLKHRRNEARRHREANSVRQKRVEHTKHISPFQTASPIQSLPAAKQCSPSQSLSAAKRASPTQSLSAAKRASPTQSLPAAKRTSPTQSPASKHASPTQSLPAAKRASPAQSLPAVKRASPTQSLPAVKRASPTQSLPAAKRASPAQSLPAVKRASPTQSSPAAKRASPTLSLPAVKRASPTQSSPAAKRASPTWSLPAAKRASPTHSLPAAKRASPTQSLPAAKRASPSQSLSATKQSSPSQSLPAAKHASPSQLMSAVKHASPTRSLNATKHHQQQQQSQQHPEKFKEKIKANIFWPGEGNHLQKTLPSSKIEKANNDQPGEGKHLLKLLSSKTDISSEHAVSTSTVYESKGHSSTTSVATASPSLPVSSTSALNAPTCHMKTVFDDNPFLGGQPVLSQFPGASPSFTVPSHNQLFPSLFPTSPFPFIRQMTPGFFPPGFPTFFPVTAPHLITFQGMSNFRSVGSAVMSNTTETSFPSMNTDPRVTEGKHANRVSDMVINAKRNSTQTTITSKKKTQCRTEMATPTRDEMKISSASEKKDQDDLGDESPGPTKKVKLEQSQTDLIEKSIPELEDSVFSVDEKYGIPGINDGGSRGVTKSLGSEMDGSGSKTGGGDGSGTEQRPVSGPLPLTNSGIKIKTDITNSSSSRIGTAEDVGSVAENSTQNVEECKKDKENSKQSLVAQTLTARNVNKIGESKMNLDTSCQTFSYEFKPSVDHKTRKTAGVKKNRNITGNVHIESTSITMSDVVQGIHTSNTRTVDKNKPTDFMFGNMHGQDQMTSFSLPVNHTSMDFLLQKPGVRFVACKSLHNTLLLNSKNQSTCDKQDKSDTWSSLNTGAKQSSMDVETVKSSVRVETQHSSSSLDTIKSLKSITESKDLTESQCFQSQNMAVVKERNLGCDLRSNSRLASVETFQSCQNFGSHNLSTFPYSQKITLPDGKASTMIFHGEQRDRRSVETVHKFMQNSRKSSSASLNQTISEVANMMRARRDMQKEHVKPLPKPADTSVDHNDIPAVPSKPGRVSPAAASQMEARKKTRQKVSFFSLKKKPMITTLVPNQELFPERNTANKLKPPLENVLSPSNKESKQLQASPNEIDTEQAKFTF